MERTTMSGPATRPNVVDAADVFAATSSEPRDMEYTGPISEISEPVILPQYEARFSVERDSGEPIVSVTIVGSPRIVDQIMHSVSDAFREEVEP